MAIYRGAARLNAYKGSYKPVNLYKGGVKIAGWSEQAKTLPATWKDTYDDHLAGAVTGVSELRADWRGVEGALSQTQTVQGKNLFDKSKATPNKYVSEKTGAILDTLIYYISGYIRVAPGSTYTCSGNQSPRRYAVYDKDKTFLQGGITNTFTTPDNACYAIVSIDKSVEGSSDRLNVYQLELGSAATAYAPFVPGSPSPDYPSPVIASVLSGTYKIARPSGGWWLLTLADDLRGIGTYQDKVELDVLTGRGRIRRNVGKKAFDGTENWALVSNWTYLFASETAVTDRLASNQSGFCTQLPVAAPSANHYAMTWHNTMQRVYVGLGALGITAAAGASAWLAAQYAAGTPVTVYYAAAAEAVTTLALTHADTSDATELTLSGLVTAEPSPDYPAEIVDAGGELVSQGRNLLPFPYPDTRKTVSGITFAVNADGSVSANGTATADVDFMLLSSTKFLSVLTPGVRYTLSGCPSGGSTATYSLRVNVYGNYDVGGGAAVTVNTAVSNLYITIRQGTAAANLIFHPMLERGAAVSAYTPYRQPSSVSLPTLRSVGDVSDTLGYAGGGVWTHTKRVGVAVFDGTEGWIRQDTYTQVLGVSLETVDGINSTDFSPVICTHFRRSDDYGDDPHGCYRYNQIRLYVPLALASNVAAFKAWLVDQYSAGTPVTVLYQLAETVVTQLSLGPLKTYPGYTRASLEAEGAEPDIRLIAKGADL